MNHSVLFDQDPETGILYPIWLMLHDYSFDWDKSLFVSIQAPFERITEDQVDSEMLALSVPDNVLVRNLNEPNEFGFNMPALAQYAQLHLGPEWDVSDIRRLMIRIGDIEDILQYSVREYLAW